jgi:beta-phosphoglucomutase
MKFSVLWDLDGTLSDSVQCFSEAMNQVLAAIGTDKRISQADYNSIYFGMTTPEILDQVLGYQLPAREKTKYTKMLFDQAQINARNGSLTKITGAEDLLAELQTKHHLMAIASSSNLEMILTELDVLHFTGYFDNIISGNLLPSKPAPDIFLVAAAALNAKPADCVVFEDSTAGVLGAKAAGMKCVAITTTKYAGDLQAADLIIHGYHEINYEKIVSLFAK